MTLLFVVFVLRFIAKLRFPQSESIMLYYFGISSLLQKSMMEIKSTRSDNLVQELYIENASLTRQLYESEITCRNTEKENQQLMAQKKALQRVITKLCGAHSLS